MSEPDLHKLRVAAGRKRAYNSPPAQSSGESARTPSRAGSNTASHITGIIFGLIVLVCLVIPIASSIMNAISVYQLSRSEKVMALISAAESDVAASRFAEPPGNNALEHYQAVLAIIPQHDEARRGLQNLFEKLAGLAEHEYVERDLSKCDRYFEIAAKIDQGAASLKRDQLYEKITLNLNTSTWSGNFHVGHFPGTGDEYFLIYAPESIVVELECQTTHMGFGTKGDRFEHRYDSTDTIEFHSLDSILKVKSASSARVVATVYLCKAHRGGIENPLRSMNTRGRVVIASQGQATSNSRSPVNASSVYSLAKSDEGTEGKARREAAERATRIAEQRDAAIREAKRKADNDERLRQEEAAEQQRQRAVLAEQQRQRAAIIEQQRQMAENVERQRQQLVAIEQRRLAAQAEETRRRAEAIEAAQAAERARLNALREAALSMQGVVRIAAPRGANDTFNYDFRWQRFDGTFTPWQSKQISNNQGTVWYCRGASIFEIKFRSDVGGEKYYKLDSNQVQWGHTPAPSEAKTYKFFWRGWNNADILSE